MLIIPPNWVVVVTVLSLYWSSLDQLYHLYFSMSSSGLNLLIVSSHNYAYVLINFLFIWLGVHFEKGDGGRREVKFSEIIDDRLLVPNPNIGLGTSCSRSHLTFMQKPDLIFPQRDFVMRNNMKEHDVRPL